MIRALLLSLLFAFSYTLFLGQSTSTIDYNYIKNGIQYQYNRGLDLKQGYSMHKIHQTNLNYSSFTRSTTIYEILKVDSRSNNSKVKCGLAMVLRRADKNYEEWFCIPLDNSSDDLWKRAFNDYKELTKAWKNSSGHNLGRGYSWGVIKALSKVYSNIESPESRNVVSSSDSHKADTGELFVMNVASNNHSPIKTIFIVNSTSEDCDGNEFSPQGFQELVSSVLLSRYDVVERTQIDIVLEESKLSETGLVDESQILEAGKLAGAQGVIICSNGCIDGKPSHTIKLVECSSAQTLWNATGSGMNTPEFLKLFINDMRKLN